jgi:dipeptidase E
MLLTSAGVQNETLTSALAELLARPFAEASIAFVVTAALGDGGHHDWLVDDINQVYRLGWRSFHIVDLATHPHDIALRRLHDADTVYVTGGNAYHLAHVIASLGLASTIGDLLDSKVYVGASAGSMIFARNFTDRLIAAYGTDDEIYRRHAGQRVSPFELFDWWVVPHARLSTDSAPGAPGSYCPAYLLDDDSAVRVVDTHVDVVSAGRWALIGADGRSIADFG